MKNELYPDAPKKQRITKDRKKRSYKYKKNSTLLLFFPRLTEYTKHYKTMMNNSIVSHGCQQASTIIVWIAKQNRYMIIKGYANQYQLDIMEVEVENLYIRYLKSKYLDYYKPWSVLDMSHIPPEAKFTNDE